MIAILVAVSSLLLLPFEVEFLYASDLFGQHDTLPNVFVVLLLNLDAVPTISTIPVDSNK